MHAVHVARLSGEPIIRPHMDDRMGSNINGPSLIRVPGWVEKPLGRYYLYFAGHKGAYIRLACADALAEASRPVRQLRDPCVYEEDGRTYLLYCGGGESGIGIAEVLGLDSD